jgi:hypothetical protein
VSWMWLLAFGCQELTPGERVLGDEVSAVVLDGQPGFGRAVAIQGERIVLGEPLHWGNWNDDITSVEGTTVRRVGFTATEPWAWLSSQLVVWGDQFDETMEVGDATSVDRCPNGDFVTASGEGESVACSSMGVLRTRCTGGRCVVQIDGGPILDEVSPGGAVAWQDDRACWGDPQLEYEEAAGRVACDDGLERMGIKGDHLGLSIGGSRTAGRFNRHIVPPRLRIVPLDAGPVWLVDRAAENSRVSLHSDGQHTAVGVPAFRQGPTSGRVYLVERP